MVKYLTFQASTRLEPSLNKNQSSAFALALLLIASLLAGCAKDADDSEEASELVLYRSAQSGMAAGN